MLPPIAPLLDPKKVLRERMKAERRAAAKARPDAGVHAASNFIRTVLPSDPGVVALYYPIKDELDTEPIAAALTEREIPMALPVTGKKRTPLTFLSYRPGDKLVPGVYGEMTPDATASIVSPTIIIAPLLAFNREGGRLGYGGGYYDRTFEALRSAGSVLAVGYAFGAQEVDALPLSPLDQPLDWIVTEREAIRC